jgi:NAD(P)H-dependent FMN reductase
MTSKSLFIPVIFGCAHEHRTEYSPLAARFVAEVLTQEGMQSEVIDARTAIHPYTCRDCKTDQHIALAQTLQKADAVIWVAPEYNHGYPGELKILLDSFYDEWNHKPVGIIGVSNGGIGGSRVVEQLRQVAVALAMIPVNNAVYFSKVESLFDEKGKMREPELYLSRIKKLLAEMTMYVERQK